MKIGIIDKVVFAVVANTSVKELRKEHPDWKACAIKKNARPRYFKMIKGTPEIGSYSQNCLKICLTGGAVWFSIYEAVEELYGKMEKVLKIKSDSNWTPNFGKGAPDYSTMRFTTCGLCALASRTGHRDILPIMCSTDYTVAKLMGVNLHRDKTLATGDACCDYLYTRPGSEIEKKWQAEHPEGTFISK